MSTNRLTYIEQLKIAAFDTANNWLRIPISQWCEENTETKEVAIRKLLRETYNTIQELKPE